MINDSDPPARYRREYAYQPTPQEGQELCLLLTRLI